MLLSQSNVFPDKLNRIFYVELISPKPTIKIFHRTTISGSKNKSIILNITYYYET